MSREPSETSLTIMTEFIDALCHKIRTPLSVISNDLSFFETLLGSAEIDRSIRRVEEIKSILSDCSQVLKISPRTRTLKETLATFVSEQTLAELDETADKKIEYSSELETSLVLLYHALNEKKEFEEARRSLISDAKVTDDIAAISIALPAHLEIKKKKSQVTFKILKEALNVSSPMLPLAYSLLTSVDAEMFLENRADNTFLIIRIPVEE